MRVNVYAEEMTDRVELVKKTTPDGEFTGIRFYLELPCTAGTTKNAAGEDEHVHLRGPFLHHPGDDDSAAVTFWGKQQLRVALQKALALLDQHDEETRIMHGDPAAAEPGGTLLQVSP